jgi:hypothetical protein
VVVYAMAMGLVVSATPAAEPDDHWAFQPVRSVTPPEVERASWVTNPIDRFVLARLEAAGLQPAPAADKRTFIRRATFDLIGLPPTEDQISDFLRDDSPDAIDRLVDRLLASPHYGERWGRHWLDVTRYADSNGLDENVAHGNAWRYRDYVVAAFNRDKPYDRFIIEQLAGDLMAPGNDPALRRERLIATGYLVLGPKVLAEPDKQKMEMDIIDEQIDTIGRSLMGLTLGCARCHEHKFDPISTEDYYALAGIFKSTRTMESFKTVARWQEHSIATKTQQDRKAKHDAKVAEQKDAVEQIKTAADQKLVAQVRKHVADYLLAAAALDGHDADVKQVETVASERKLNPAFLKQWHVYLVRIRDEPDSLLQPWHALSNGADAVPDTRELLGEPLPTTREALAERYQTIFDTDESPVVQQVLKDASGPFAVPENAESFYSAATRTELTGLRKPLEALEKAAPVMPSAMGVLDGEIGDVRVHVRGSHLTLGDTVARRVPRFLDRIGGARFDETQSGRLQLARWITAADHPLTSRVLVNRIWRWHFGRGLVETPDNFGLRGESPGNPALLDWLAKRFVDDGWSIKALHRLIMRSSTYRMSSTHDPVAERVDPGNRLGWRMPVRRLEAEVIRDTLLATGGTLDLEMGGSLLNVNNREFVFNHTSRDNTGYASRRRSLYLPVIRNHLYDMFTLFDYTDASVPNGDRATTTIAPQALFLMNSEFVAEVTEHMAAALLAGTDEDDGARIARLYLRAYARPPTEAETASARAYIERFDRALRATEPDAERRRLRAWAAWCQVIVAANEFVYVN